MKKVLCFFCILGTLFLCSCSLVRAAIYNPVIHTDFWKSEIPETIPKFKCGILDKAGSKKIVDEDSISYTLSYIFILRQDVDAYEKALKDAGFAVSTTTGDDQHSVIGEPQETPQDCDSDSNGSIQYPTIIAEFTPSNGTCLVIITVDNPDKPVNTLEPKPQYAR